MQLNAVRRQIFRRQKFYGAVRRCAEKLNRVCFIRDNYSSEFSVVLGDPKSKDQRSGIQQ